VRLEEEKEEGEGEKREGRKEAVNHAEDDDTEMQDLIQDDH